VNCNVFTIKTSQKGINTKISIIISIAAAEQADHDDV